MNYLTIAILLSMYLFIGFIVSICWRIIFDLTPTPVWMWLVRIAIWPTAIIIAIPYFLKQKI